MKNLINKKNEPRLARFHFTQLIKRLMFGALIITGLQIPSQAQQFPSYSDSFEVEYTKPFWRFGAALGANFNYYEGTTQQLSADLTVPTPFRYGNGIGLFLAPLVEYQNPDKRLGAMLQVGYDSRRGEYDQVISVCNCPEDLSTNLSYLTIEPSLRFAPFKSNLYIYGGPRLAFNLQKSFTYQLGVNPDFPAQAGSPEVKADFNNVENMLISMQIGAGYDFPISSQDRKTQWMLSPFVVYHPYFGANPRSTETWTMNTLRAGIAIKFGRGREIFTEQIMVQPAPVVEVKFTVTSPKNVPVDRRVRETFPLRNYVFFDLESTEIPERYVALRKDQVKDFREDRLEVFTPKKLTGTSKRQMDVYYNVINILGDRMKKNPSTTITLVGSSDSDAENGRELAKSIQTYLVDIFGIKESRIAIVGRVGSKVSSEQPGATQELELLRAEDRRVSIETDSPILLMEFQSGPNAPLKPVDLTVVEPAPLDSYITFHVEGALEAFTSWSLEITDKKGAIQYFGPYAQEIIRLPGKTILGSNADGRYDIRMIGMVDNDTTSIKKATVEMVLWKVPEDEMAARYSVIFEFNDSRSISIYDEYLTEIVTPKIPKGATLLIHGYTDTIGNAENNKRLSLARANEVQRIIKEALAKVGRTDVKFKVFGFGEDNELSPFKNKYPEERFYNRIVLIDILPSL